MPICVVCRTPFEGRADAKTCGDACRMAKSRRRGKKLEFVKIKRGDSKYSGNCVPHAISQATGMAFQWIETMLLEQGKKLKPGYPRKVYEPVLHKLGFVEVVEGRGMLLDEMILENGVWYLACSRDHMVAVRDGEMFDVTHIFKKRRRRLVELWRMRPLYTR